MSMTRADECQTQDHPSITRTSIDDYCLPGVVAVHDTQGQNSDQKPGGGVPRRRRTLGTCSSDDESPALAPGSCGQLSKKTQQEEAGIPQLQVLNDVCDIYSSVGRSPIHKRSSWIPSSESAIDVALSPPLHPPELFPEVRKYGLFPGELLVRWKDADSFIEDQRKSKILMSTVDPNSLMLCKLKRLRKRKGSTSKFKTTFTLNFECESGGDIQVLETKRSFKGKNVQYAFKVGTKDLGKLKCNLRGTKFVVYDSGQKLKKRHDKTIPAPDECHARQELANVTCSTSKKGPRELLVQLVHDTKGYPEKKFLVNAVPDYDADRREFTLEYHGRARVSSVKNFQLIADSYGGSPDHTPLLRLGKESGDVFNLDFRWPLSPLQAFAIALTSFE
eukprot:m.20576 g.20576  ORF g.20576 m.20576 type:complete len:390 (+) comp12170_c0_seq1:222-1391(+)